jgi:hypothetical protein
VLHGLRAHPRAHRGERGQRDHLALGISHVEAPDVLGLGARPLVGLHEDAVDAPVLVEVVDVERAQVDLQRRGDVGDRDAEGLGLGAVDVHVELRRRRPEGRVEPDEIGPGIAALDDVLREPGEGLQILAAEVLDLELDAPVELSPRMGGGPKATTTASLMPAN